MPEPRVLVVAPNWLGDAVMALPALADVRRAYRASRLIVAARSSVAPLYAMVPGVDGTIVTEWRGSLRNRQALANDVERVKAEQVDLAILFPNSFASAWGLHRAAVPQRWGYAADFRGPLLTRAIKRPGGSRHQGAYYQHLVRQLGIPNGPLEPSLSIPSAAVEESRAVLAARGWTGSRPLLVVAPGAAYGTAKRWLPGYFAALVTRAIQETGAHGVIVGSHGPRLDEPDRPRVGERSDGRHHVTDACRRDEPRGRLRVERFRRYAHCRSGRHAAGGYFRPDTRSRNGAAHAPRRPRGRALQSGLVPAVHAP
jgi:ADP-heptose:LPS heptosyltransferase